MPKKTRLAIIALVIATFLTGGLAIYFATQHQQAEKQLVEYLKTSKVEIDKVNLSTNLIDSLLFAGDYKKAMKLTEELSQGQAFSEENPLNFRYRIAKSMADMQRKMSTRQVNPVPKTSLEEMETTSEDDSLQTELYKIQSELAKLKQKLDRKPKSKYLQFKTSKGTALHYVGTIENNQATGFGIALLETGSRYEGEWKEGQRHGTGKFFWDDGQRYEGEYKNDMREGLGTYFWVNGEKYVGEWKNDQRNGRGEFYNKRGKLKTTGIWKNDILIEENRKLN